MAPSATAAHASGMNEIPAILRLADGAVVATYPDGFGVRIAPDDTTSAYTRDEKRREPRTAGTGDAGAPPQERTDELS